MLRVEHRDPFGIGIAAPRLSWINKSEQTAYEVEIDGLSTGVVESSQSVLVPWPARPLRSREGRQVRVRARDERGSWAAWSDPVTIEAGLLHPDDWRGRFVAVDVPVEATALVRKGFELPEAIERGRLYVSALGVLEIELNGQHVDDHVLHPGWTSYDHRLNYATIDVTPYLEGGSNAIGFRVADGWYRGRIGWGAGKLAIYGDRLAVLAQLEVRTADGDHVIASTDATWRWTHGPTTRASLYDGEDYDARQERLGWSTASCDDADWLEVEPMERDLSTLVARSGPPVRRIEELPPRSIEMSPSGKTIVDFGQNLVGRLRMRVDAPAGTVVTLRHAEIVEDGELCTEPLRTAEATDRYTAAGGGIETWEPRFTFHGFRYAEVTGAAADVTAIVCHSDLRRTGWFECSDDRVNRLHENVVWSMRGNFLDLPTDCPQRDERLGWTGDITVFAPTACFLYDVTGFLASWLADLAAEQDDLRGVPFVIPNVSGDEWIGTAVWGDAAVAVPWALFQASGDVELLRMHYPSMRRWVDLVVKWAGPDRHWEFPFQWGDWLDPAAPPDDPAAARTDRHLVANAWFCRSLQLLASAAENLDETDDAARYRAIEAEARDAFVRRYVTEGWRMTSDAQTAYALAIHFGLLDGPQRAAAGDRLAELVRAEGCRIGTGFAGTPVVCDALCDSGHVDTAYRLLLQTEPPSWLYPVLHGATTIWERWDGIRPDGTRNPGEMNSFNHYALGAVADWLHRSVAGLAPGAPGYRKLLVRPRPGDGLDHARARQDTPYGRAEAGWRRDRDAIVVSATVPPGTTATIALPDGSIPFEVGPGAHEWRVRSGG